MARVKHIFIIDESPLIYWSFSHLLNSERELNLCGHSPNCSNLIPKIKEKSPHLIISEIVFKNQTQIKHIEKVKDHFPSLPLLVFSRCREFIFAEKSFQLGVQGYLLKKEDLSNIIEAIDHLLSGKVFICQKFSDRILKFYSQNDTSDLSRGLVATLSPREFEVFEFIGQGHDLASISSFMEIDKKTVETYHHRIKKKLSLNSAPQLKSYALRWQRMKRS